MRTPRRSIAFVFTVPFALVAFASEAAAQNNPQDALGSAIGAVATGVNGVLGNAPGDGGGGRSGSRGRRRGRTPAVSPLSAASPRTLLVATADGYMNLPLETFLTTRSLQPPPFNWQSDGCRFGEIAGPFRDSFNRACHRHTFGYRNYGAGGLALDTTEARRTRIDDRLRDDLNGLCRSDHRGVTESPCLAAAQAVYASARATGRNWFFNNAPPPPSLPIPAVPGFGGTNNGPIPGIPLPVGGNQGGGNNGLPVQIPGVGGGNNGLPVPVPGVGGNSLPLPIPH